MICYRLLVEGRVQGVGFRYFTKRKAQTQDVQGYVVNKWDGSVEIVLQGPEKAVNEVITWCKKGPLLAKVTNVTIKKEKVGNYKDFKIMY